MSGLYEHSPHPHTVHVLREKCRGITVRGQLPTAHKNRFVRFNARTAILMTGFVGSMWCAYIFAALAFAGLPVALKPGNIGFLFWFSSDLLQLVLLSVIIVGQNIQAQASDVRSEATFQDAQAVLAEALKIQAHLAEQDRVLIQLQGKQKMLWIHSLKSAWMRAALCLTA